MTIGTMVPAGGCGGGVGGQEEVLETGAPLPSRVGSVDSRQ